jgi:hypothetical protein
LMTKSAQRHPRLFVVQVLSPALLVVYVCCEYSADFAIRVAKKIRLPLVRINSKLGLVLTANRIKPLSSF